jgi:excisionase family DNA binding protein
MERDRMRNEEILTTADAAKLLNLTPDGVRWLERNGRLRTMRTVSGQRLFFKSEVLRLLARRDAAADAPSMDAA